MSAVLSIWKGPINIPGDAVRDCLERAARNHGVTVADIKAGNALRARKYARARGEACYRLRSLQKKDGRPRLSFPRIAQLVGLKDHTSVMTAVIKFQERKDRDNGAH